jgi:hypothetical protein
MSRRPARRRSDWSRWKLISLTQGLCQTVTGRTRTGAPLTSTLSMFHFGLP